MNRLRSQILAGRGLASAHDVVAHFGAMQAQDYLGALWAVGLRMRNAVESDVERALDEGRIVRCWPMRGTLHVVAAEDVRWMLDLLAPRVLKRHRIRLERDFELDSKTLRTCRTIVERALRAERAMTRPEIYAALTKGGIMTNESRGLHILFALAHERVIVFGPRRGRQPQFVAFDEWVPATGAKTREDALAELARRYMRGHAPATRSDLAWWAGLTLREADEALTLAGVAVNAAPRRTAGPTLRLLPPFDEYTVGYKDRAGVLEAAFAKRVNAGGGILNAVVVIDGLVRGTWKRTLRGTTGIDITVYPFRLLSDDEAALLDKETARYAAFLERDDVRLRTERPAL